MEIFEQREQAGAAGVEIGRVRRVGGLHRQGLAHAVGLHRALLAIPPDSIDAVVLTHAHLDHSGYLPKLVRDGFRGPVYCSSATADLCDILLKDSARIAENDAEYANRRGHTKHKPALPLYTVRDAEAALKQLKPIAFETETSVEGGAKMQLRHAGHILGAATVEFNWQGRGIVFSGDLGRYDDVFMPDPAPVNAADYVVVESTYGDRIHPKNDPMEALGAVVERTVRRGGTVVIPAFAVGRTQVLLYHLWMLKRAGRIQSVPIFLDSPMAINATELLCGHLDDHSILVSFLRVAPSAFSDSVYTDSAGNFTITIPTGFYYYSLKKIDYIGVFYTAKQFYVNTVVADTTLESIGLIGNIKGILTSGTYKVSGNITISNTDTLIISPGTILKFKSPFCFRVRGLLIAEGTVSDSIVFTSYTSTTRWGGLKFYSSNSNSNLSYSLVERADSFGVTIKDCSPFLHNLIIRNCNGHGGGAPPPYYGGGGVFLSNSNSVLDSITIHDNYSTFGAGIFSHLGHPIIKNSTIRHNNAGPGPGGILLDNNSILEVINTRITDNYTTTTSLTVFSNGITAAQNSILYARNCLISNNKGKPRRQHCRSDDRAPRQVG